MENPEKNHPLLDVWKIYPDVMYTEEKSISNILLEHLIGDIFSVGEYYYYVLNFTDSSLSHHHENLLKIHGLEKYPGSLKEIIDLVHPEDIPFVLKAEQAAIEKILSIGQEHQLYLKSSYCFRMKSASGNYELFHHQAIHTLEDEQHRLLQAINIHTNIHHITQENSHIVLISGIGPRDDFHQIKIDNQSVIHHVSQKKLTKREGEILSMIGKGFSGKEISQALIISEHTVKTHRKNILKKTNSRNSRELIKKAFECGLI